MTTTVIVLEGGKPYGFKVTTRLSDDVLIPTPLGVAVPFTTIPKLSVVTVLGLIDLENVNTTSYSG